MSTDQEREYQQQSAMESKIDSIQTQVDEVCTLANNTYDVIGNITDLFGVTEKYTGETSTWGNGIVMKEVNTKMIQDTEVDINTSDYPDFCDSHFVSATWIDGTELTEEELEYLDDTDGFLYECIEKQLY